MSIIKDNANGGKRIVRFTNGLIPKTDASGNLISGGSGRYAQTYADMGTGTTGWFQIDGNASVNDSILILASIPQDSNGYFFGCYKSTGIGVWLRKSGDKVYFKCGGSTSAEVSVDWKEGFHVYGFIHSENGTRLLYDKRYVNESSYTSPLTSSDHYYVGRCYGRLSSSSDSPANVLIGKVVAMTDKTYHYYPTSTSVNGVTPCGWYETREYQNVRKSIGLTSGISAPYGISIEDLREITGSPYHDLVAILMADNGRPAEGADTADYLTLDGTTHNFAFTLAPTEYDSYTREQLSIPHPAGTTVQPATRPAGDSWRGYAKGELINGRKPYWRIWADGQNLHLFVHPAGNYDPEDPYDGRDGYLYRYLLFVDKFQNDTVDLKDFEGWSNVSKEHAPFLRTIGDLSVINVEYHNRTLCFCNASTVINDHSNNGYLAHKDEMSIFTDTKKVGGSVNMALGNLPNWNDDYNTVIHEAVNHPYGMAAMVRCQLYNNTERNVMRAFALTELRDDDNKRIPFCDEYLLTGEGTEDNQRQLTLFRSGRDGLNEDAPLKAFDFEMYTDQLSTDDMNSFMNQLHDNPNHDIQAHIELATLTNYVDGLPDEWQWFIFARRMVGQIPITIHGDKDTKYFEATQTNYRFILRTPTVRINNTTYYVYPIWTSDVASGCGYPKTRFDSSAQNGGIAFFFCLWADPLNTEYSGDYIDPVDISGLGNISARVKLTGHPTRSGRTTEWYSVELSQREPIAGQTSALQAVHYSAPDVAAVLEQNFRYTVFPEGNTHLEYNTATLQNNYSKYVFKVELPNTDIGVKHYTHGYRAGDDITTNYVISSDTTVELWLGE